MSIKDIKILEKVEDDESFSKTPISEEPEALSYSETQPLVGENDSDDGVNGTQDSLDLPADHVNDDIDKEHKGESTQGAVNLLGVDVARISEFAGYNQEILGSLLKILLAGWFLVKLIGWRRYVPDRVLALLY